MIFFFRDENLVFAACPYLPADQNLWIFYKMISVKSSSSAVPLSPPISNSSRHAAVSSSHHAALLSSHVPAGCCFAPCFTAILSSRPPLTVPPSCCLIVPAGCCVASRCAAIPLSCHAALSSSRRPLTAPPSHCPRLVILVFRKSFFGRKKRSCQDS